MSVGVAERRIDYERKGSKAIFFQAEDGIRDIGVTGVQTCALPILRVGRTMGLPVVNPVDLEGRFDQRVTDFAGQFVKAADPHIIDKLRELGVLLKAGEYTHTYPFCWRCKTPLLYYAKPSWYIATTKIADRLLATNATTNWQPEHIRDGRYGDWLANNIDWSLSRERY